MAKFGTSPHTNEIESTVQNTSPFGQDSAVRYTPGDAVPLGHLIHAHLFTDSLRILQFPTRLPAGTIQLQAHRPSTNRGRIHTITQIRTAALDTRCVRSTAWQEIVGL